MFASLSPPLRALLRAHGVIDRNNDNKDSNDDGGGDVVVIDDLDDALEWCEEQVSRFDSPILTNSEYYTNDWDILTSTHHRPLDSSKRAGLASKSEQQQ